MVKNKDVVKFEDEIGEILINLIKDTKKKKLDQQTWRGLVGEQIYKISVFIKDGQLIQAKIEAR